MVEKSLTESIKDGMGEEGIETEKQGQSFEIFFAIKKNGVVVLGRFGVERVLFKDGRDHSTFVRCWEGFNISEAN